MKGPEQDVLGGCRSALIAFVFSKSYQVLPELIPSPSARARLVCQCLTALLHLHCYVDSPAKEAHSFSFVPIERDFPRLFRLSVAVFRRISQRAVSGAMSEGRTLEPRNSIYAAF